MLRTKIAVIDYGFGNIKSVVSALCFCGAEGYVVDSPLEISKFCGVVLPGVGAFGPAMDFLKLKGFDKAIFDYVSSGKILYGICLGFQLFFTKGYENGEHNGLNLIPGEVKKFEFKDRNFKIPHIGWNNIDVVGSKYSKKMFNSINHEATFYFIHSYYAIPENSSHISSFCDYGIKFCSSLAYKNIWGSQFHPEKSGEKGLKILANFISEVNNR
ncbi:MAG: imidazole glycerol phosphate synthase subunit HisH [Endomicrobium sp.]|jgi:glutamine amidotransferase|nr:imidazole glycerol phosphate synthase subunit HisH [Endomicrobium sp.]